HPGLLDTVRQSPRGHALPGPGSARRSRPRTPHPAGRRSRQVLSAPLDPGRTPLPDRLPVRPLVLVALCCGLLMSACRRGPQYCLFDGTETGAAPLPSVPRTPDGPTAPRPSRYNWREFVWPTDPAWEHVRRDGAAWLFEGTTGGTPWTFHGTFSPD